VFLSEAREKESRKKAKKKEKKRKRRVFVSFVFCEKS
jgi:hypothetical protein